MTRSKTTTPEVLADWHYSPEEWKEYVEYEKQERENEIPDFLKNSLYYIAAAGIVLLIVVLISAQFAAVIFILMAVPVFLAFAVGTHWLIRKSELATMDSRPGDVKIMTNGVSINGLWFDWEFGGDRTRFLTATRSTNYTTTGKLNLLEFKCLVKIRVRGMDQNFDKKWRVPIPNGKEQEADVVIQKLYQAKAMFSSADSKTDFSAQPIGISAQTNFEGHDFTASTVCKNCGGSIEAVTHFNWKCQR